MHAQMSMVSFSEKFAGLKTNAPVCTMSPTEGGTASLNMKPFGSRSVMNSKP